MRQTPAIERIRGREDLLAQIGERVSQGQQIVCLHGPNGSGKRTVARAALHAVHRQIITIRHTTADRFDEVLDEIIAQSETLTRDPAVNEAQFASHLARQGYAFLFCDTSPMEPTAWQKFRQWIATDKRLFAFFTSAQPLEAADGVSSFAVPAWDAERKAQRDAAIGVFLDAVSDAALRSQLSSMEESVQRDIVISCGGLPLLLQQAGARTRFLDGNHVIQVLISRDSPHYLASLSALFGNVYLDSLKRTLTELPEPARFMLPIFREIGPAFTIEELLSVLQRILTLETPTDPRRQPTAGSRALIVKNALVDQLQLLTDVGFVEVQRNGKLTSFRLPGHIQAVLDDLLSTDSDETQWRSIIPGAAVSSLARGAADVLSASDTYQESAARDRARRLREPLIHLVQREAFGTLLNRVEQLLCLGALAWFWRRIGVDRRLWSRCFQLALDASSPDGFLGNFSLAPSIDLAAMAITEVHLLARQAGDAAARDALAGRMAALMGTFDDIWDRGSASARSRFGYVLAAAAFTAGDTKRAREIALQSLADAQTAARHDLHARHSTVLAYIEFESGEHATAVNRMEEAVAVLARAGATQEHATATSNLAILAYQHGALDLSCSSFRQSAEALEGSWDKALQTRALLGLARSLDVLQRSEAAKVHAKVLASTEELGDDAQRAEALQRYAWHLLLQKPDQETRAIELFQQAIELEQSVGRERLRTHTMHAWALALAMLDRTTEAYDIAQRTLERIQPSRVQHHLEVRALVAALDPSITTARTVIEELRQQSRTIGSDATEILLVAESLYVALRELSTETNATVSDTIRAPLSWLLTPVAPQFGTIRIKRPRWQRSLTLASIMRRIYPLLDPELLASIESELYRQPGDLLISQHAARVQLPDGQWVNLGGTGVLARLLHVIASHGAEYGYCSVDACMAAGWPGESIQYDAALNRIYQAISRLRKLGLRDAIEAYEGGYRMQPGLTVVLPPAFGRP